MKPGGGDCLADVGGFWHRSRIALRSIRATGATRCSPTWKAYFAPSLKSELGLRQRDGRTLNLRKSTVAEPDLMQIYQALHLNPAPGGTKKLVC